MQSEISTALIESLRSCVRELCDLAATGKFGNEILSPWEVWQQGEDGHFRPETKLHLTALLSDLDSMKCFQECLALAEADPVVGPQLDRLVGPADGMRFRLELQMIIRSLMGRMVSDEKHIEFSDQQFQESWRPIEKFLVADEFKSVTLAPFPNLVAPFPVKLAEYLMIDRFTDEEVTRCVRSKMLEPLARDFPLIWDDAAVGVRYVGFSKKVIEDASTGMQISQISTRGEADALISIDHVLTALRLLKDGTATCPGNISFHDVWHVGSAITFRYRDSSRFHESIYRLQENEIPELKDLWRALAEPELSNRKFLVMALRRFKIAFDRSSIEDRVVDLMIAAESLFLTDTGGAKDRGELKFRMAIRASRFVDCPSYSQRDVFELMRTAYDIRSSIVHGGSVDKTKLPHNPKATLNEFVTAFEQIMRLSIKKAIKVPEIGTLGYWTDILFDDSPQQ